MSVRIIVFGWMLALAVSAVAQQEPDFKIRTIRRQQIEAPSYNASGTGADLGGRPSTLWRQWYKIEVQFSSRPEWADDIQMKYYVLVGTGRDQRMFSGEITHVNVARGTQHYSAMFMHPNTLRRYGGGEVQAVAVQLFHQNRLVDQTSDPTTGQRWWERFSPVPGYLLPPEDTPWAPIASERWEARKITPR
jgi:hypothetical protein